MSQLGAALLGGAVDQGSIENYKKVVFGVLIAAFLIKEPGGLARLPQRLRERARVWPLRAW